MKRRTALQSVPIPSYDGLGVRLLAICESYWHTAELDIPDLLFYVSGQSHILTNEHVVNGCREVRIPPATSVAIVARDRARDLALLMVPPGANQAIVKFRQGRGIRPGDDIVVVG